MRKRRAPGGQDKSLDWLPVDSRLIAPLFSFGHVRGWARVFLIVEMLLATFVVLGTLTLVLFTVFR